MKLRHKILLPIVAILVLYRIGPVMDTEPSDNELPMVMYDINSVSSFVANKEAQFNTKQDNEARIIWGDSANKKTEYVLLYLHGFSASWYEGYPVNTDFQKHFGCNAYFARLHEHGLVSGAPLLDMTPKKLYDSAKEALLIAKTLGDKVIIMSTSTGGTLSLMLAADYPDLVAGQILYSPNIEIKQGSAKLLPMPWGLQLGKIVEGEMRKLEGSELESKYWDLEYRIEATIYLQQLLNERMNESTFSKVTCPTFVGYYYKDKKNQDNIVRVSAIKEMYNLLGSEVKQEISFPDAERHTIAFVEAGNPAAVTEATIDFVEEMIMKN